MNADKRLALYNLTREPQRQLAIVQSENTTKKLLTRGASYKPPALPGDIYFCPRAPDRSLA